MRRPDRTEETTWYGELVNVQIWIDETEYPWDGDEPLEPGSEGYDILVRVSFGHFRGQSSLGSVWIYPNKEGRDYLEAEIKDVTGEALSDLETEVRRIASGEDVDAARSSQALALAVTRKMA